MTAAQPANDDDPHLIQCVGCERLFPCTQQHFNYSDGESACADCSPTYAEAQKGFEGQAFEEPDAYRHFKRRLANHLAAGGERSAKYLNAPID